MKNVIFITGIDTNCGKTFITGHLAKKELEKGKKVITHKLVQTGCNGISEDIIEHRKIMQMPLLEEDKKGETCPYVFSYPASPHFSSELENIQINKTTLINSLTQISEKYELVFCEGAGGLIVPLTQNYNTVHFLKEFKIPIIFVTSSKLGSINHTLLTLESCKQYKLKIIEVIYNVLPNSDTKITENTYLYFKALFEKEKIRFTPFK